MLTIDFETRSEIDLRKTGPWVYAEHPSTEILCMAFKFGEAITKIHIPEKFRYPEVLQAEELKGRIKDFSESAQKILDYDFILEAHHAEFERALWHYVCHKRWGWPDIPITRWRCSAAKSAALSLPRALGDVSRVLELPVLKDTEGRKIMLKTCKPRPPKKAEKVEWLIEQKKLSVEPAFTKKGRTIKKCSPPQKDVLDEAGKNMPTLWHEKPEDLIILFKYCIRDVDTEKGVSTATRSLNPKEQRLWFLDQTINTRGIKIDIENVKKALNIIKTHEKKSLEELKVLTGGVVKSVRQIAATREWLATKGVALENLQKATVEEALKDPFNIESDSARRVLEIRQSLGKSSTSKLTAMINSSNKDGRARGLLMYHGASTGRWSGRRIQPQNLPRPEFSDTELCVKAFDDPEFMEILWGDPMRAIASCTRNMLIAGEGKDFICGDFSSVEAGVLAWLAGEEIVLDAFRRGEDIYKLAATAIYSVPLDSVTKAQRQIGKVAVLALGYQGAVGAFQQMAIGYGVKISDTLAREIVTAWRKKHTNITKFWKENEYAALRAIKTGKTVRVANVFWGVHGDFLFCKLPSGRLMAYYKPEAKQVPSPYGMKTGITYMGTDSKTYKWTRIYTYGGKLVENMVQAISRDILVAAMFRTEEAEYKTVLHVHDEILSEVPENFGSTEEFEAIMTVAPDWAKGCPIGAKAWRGKRYRK